MGESCKDNPYVTTDMGSQEAHKYKFLSYIECSAKLFENCDQVFYEAIKAVFDIRKLSPVASSGAAKSSSGFCLVL